MRNLIRAGVPVLCTNQRSIDDILGGSLGGIAGHAWDEVDGEGRNAGLEIDIARYIALRLMGSENRLKLVPMAGFRRIDGLIERGVDLAIASLSMTDDRRSQINERYREQRSYHGAVEPDTGAEATAERFGIAQPHAAEGDDLGELAADLLADKDVALTTVAAVGADSGAKADTTIAADAPPLSAAKPALALMRAVGLDVETSPRRTRRVSHEGHDDHSAAMPQSKEF